MALHLLKLCVGCDSVEDLDEWIAGRMDELRRVGAPLEHIHTTRMIPRRKEDLLDGGSLYWVIRGNVQARQRLLDIRPFRDAEGVQRCRLILEPQLTETAWQPHRPFQGWRYLEPKQAPRDLGAAGQADLPLTLRRELAELGLL